MLDHSPDAVPRARRFVTAALATYATAELVSDTELVVAELVTNALLHGSPPVVLAVAVDAGGVRVEVRDGSRLPPVVGLGGTDAMTGRGLGLVATLARRWGIEPAVDGKAVWAELTADPADPGAEPDDVDIDALLAAWTDDEAEPRFRIELGDVPTDLLLAAKAHVDNLVREFALTTSGAASGHTARVPAHLAALIESVTSRFAEARQAIKRQAITAAQRREPRTRLVLDLPVGAADAGEEYLAALDAADGYARAARLLTLETPYQHRAFRHWYVETLVHRLRSAARGEDPGPPTSFEAHLLSELAAVSEARRAAEREARLQEVTAALAGAMTAEEVATAVLSTGVAALGASGGSLLVPSGDSRLGVPGAVGYAEELVAVLREERPDARLPAAEALRTGEPVWLESPAERDARFPELTDLEPGTVSMCAVPLRVRERILGALRFSFSTQRLFDPDERRFAMALAAQTAQALDRAYLHATERQARAEAEAALTRLARLQRVTSELAAARDVDEVADIVVAHASGALGARVTSLSVITAPGTLRVLRIVGARPEAVARWQTYAVDADLPASAAVRTGEPQVFRSAAALLERYPVFEGASEQVLVCVPLLLGAEALGALSVGFPADIDLDDGEIDVLMTLGRQCALALSRVWLFESERAARRRTGFLARASELLTSSLDPDETVRHLTTLVVPELADYAVVYLVDPAHGTPYAVAFEHRDAAVSRFAREMLLTRPLDLDAPGGVAEVLRTGRAIRYESVPDLVRRRAADVPDPAVAEALVPTTGIAVALTVRGTRIGAMGLARTDGPPYTDDDQVLVEELANRAAVAMLNAQQFSRERDAAVTLQRSLLPQKLPRVPGLTFAWRYLPGGSGGHVGGDWYDVIPLGDDRVGVLIGDVMGRGVQAAAIMGQLRATARAYASTALSPAALLDRLDQAVSGLEQGSITTAVYGVLDPRSGRFTVASAGHLPPLLVPADGDPVYVDVDPGPPLGVGGSAYVEQTVTVPRPSTLLLYTDGLVEDHDRPVDAGMRALAEAARGLAEPEELCDRALQALGRADGHDDDTALLAVRVDAG